MTKTPSKMNLSITITKVRNFLTKKRIIGIIPTLDEIIESDLESIQTPELRQNYISKTFTELYNVGETETAFEIVRNYQL